MLDVTWVGLLSEVTHLVVALVGFKLASDHKVQRLEEQTIKVIIKLLLRSSFLQFLEVFCILAHQEGSLVAGEVNINRISKVRYLGRDHVSRVELGVGHVAVFTSVPSLVLSDLLSALVVWTGWIVEVRLSLEIRQVAVEEVKTRLVNVVLVSNIFLNFFD